MHALRCVAAEWSIVRARLFHTRLGVWLVLLSATLAWAAPPDSLARLAVRTGLLAGVLCVAFAAGAKSDRAALPTTLAHPTWPLAVAAGRWLGATVAAALAVTGVTVAVGVPAAADPSAMLLAGAAGFAAAAAAAACALPAVLAGGNTCAALLIAGLVTLGDAPALGATTAVFWAGACVLVGVPAAAALLGRAR